MQQSTTKPEDFLASLPDGVREDMTALDAAISAVMDGHPKVVWEGRFWGGSDQRIIGYGEYRYTSRSGKSGEWFICGLAAQKNYITVFVNAVADVELLVLTELVERARELTPAS